MVLTFVELDEFKEDVKKLRKYRHLEEDIERLKKVMEVSPIPHGAVLISEKNRKFSGNIYKLLKFHSQDFPGKGARSGIRVIFHYNEADSTITFCQIYYHEREDSDYDRRRLEKNFPRGKDDM
jgi:mRNA-degrading endonuclease RelE of RelBE toxin-antitoxin system